MKNLLVIAQRVDETDDLRGFFVGWLREFSRHFNKVFVITIGKGNYNLPSNVFIYSLGYEIGASKIKKFRRFYKYLFRLTPKSQAIFAHMSPIFVILSWPAAKIFRKKIILWYSHRKTSFKLRAAAFLSDKILTSSESSLTLRTSKKIVTGHGIDTDYFKLKPQEDVFDKSKIWRITSIGRISPIKDYITIIKTMSILKKKGYNVKLKIIGRPIYPKDGQYLQQLKDLINSLKLQKNVDILDYIPYNQLPPVYQETDILINGSPTGGLDKVVLEAMASGVVIFVANKGFAQDLGSYQDKFIFQWNDPADLSNKIELYLKNPISIGPFLRSQVIKRHNIQNILNNLAAIMG